MNGGAFPSSLQTTVSGRILSLCFGGAGPPWNYAVSSRTRTVGWLALVMASSRVRLGIHSMPT